MQLLNTFDLVAQHRSQRSKNVAVIDAEKQISYGELHDLVLSVSSQLSSLGVKAGDRIAVCLNKGTEEILVFFALAHLEAVSVILNYRWKAHQCHFAFVDCAVKMVVTDARKLSELLEYPEFNATASVVTIKDNLVETQSTTTLSTAETAVKPNDFPVPENLAAILYTSGSTGMPKGVMLTHETLIEGAKTVAGYLNNNANDCILSILPLSFDYGLNQLTTMFLVGGKIVLQKTAMVSAIVENLQSFQITGIAGVPTLLIDIVSYLDEAKIRLAHLRYVTNSGGKIPDKILKKMAEIFDDVDIYLMYGFTEAFRSTFLHPASFRDKLGSIGKAVPGVDIYVVHPERGICAPHEVGELVHCRSLISSGYWGNRRETRKKIRPCKHLHEVIGDQPVAFSGDFVRYDEDGFLWFVARMDEMIKSSGNRISPTEIEEIVYKSGFTRYAVAFGVDDERLGQVVHLVITPLEQGFQKESLQRYCREQMPPYMIPGEIYIWEESMPTTSNGKIDRKFVIENVLRTANVE